MPLSTYTRRRLAFGLQGEAAGDSFADIVDAGTGTLPAYVVRRLRFNANSGAVGSGIATKVNTSAALSDAERDALGRICQSRVAANEIAAALAL